MGQPETRCVLSLDSASPYVLDQQSGSPVFQTNLLLRCPTGFYLFSVRQERASIYLSLLQVSMSHFHHILCPKPYPNSVLGAALLNLPPRIDHR